MEIGLEEVLAAELHETRDVRLFRVLVRLLDALRIDVDAVGADAVALGGGDRNAAIARAEVVEHVALVHVGELEHRVDHLLRRRDEDDIGLLLGDRLRRGGSGGAGKEKG